MNEKKNAIMSEDRTSDEVQRVPHCATGLPGTTGDT